MNFRTCQGCGYNRKVIDNFHNWCFHPSNPTGVVVYSKGECEGWARWPKDMAIAIKKEVPKAVGSVFVFQSDSSRGKINKRKYSMPLKNDKVKEFIKSLKGH